MALDPLVYDALAFCFKGCFTYLFLILPLLLLFVWAVAKPIPAWICLAVSASVFTLVILSYFGFEYGFFYYCSDINPIYIIPLAIAVASICFCCLYYPRRLKRKFNKPIVRLI